MVSREELIVTVQRMESRLQGQGLWRLYQELVPRFEKDLQASERDVALAKSAALMMLQAAAQGQVAKPEIRPLDRGVEFYTPERCYIIELSNTPQDAEASIALARVVPGVSTRWHRLVGTTERYVIIEGRGRVEIGELAPRAVAAGDVVLIPPLCRQRITNVGQDDLAFLAICTPRFRQENYEEAEKP